MIKNWFTTLAVAFATAAVLLGVGIALVGGDSPRRAEAATERTPPLPAAAPPATTPPQSGTGARAARLGPEGVPMNAGRALGPARSPAPGRSAGGIPCVVGEQLVYHVHARLTLFVHGHPRAVPLGIGIGSPRRITSSPSGDFVSAGSCFSYLHTHASDGVIHIEAPGKVSFRLGQFFDVWNQRLDRRHLGAQAGRVVAYVNGQRFRGDPRAIALRPHAQITLELGGPLRPASSITFPPGL